MDRPTEEKIQEIISLKEDIEVNTFLIPRIALFVQIDLPIFLLFLAQSHQFSLKSYSFFFHIWRLAYVMNKIQNRSEISSIKSKSCLVRRQVTLCVLMRVLEWGGVDEEWWDRSLQRNRDYSSYFHLSKKLLYRAKW